MDAELEQIPGLGTLTARSLAGHDLEGLGGQADGALDAEVLGLGAVDELGADLLEGLDLAGGQGDADAVSLGGLAVALVALLVRRHLDWSSFLGGETGVLIEIGGLAETSRLERRRCLGVRYGKVMKFRWV